MKTFGRIRAWLAPYRASMAAAMELTTLAALCSLPVPRLVRELVDRVVTHGGWRRLPLYAAGLLAVFVPGRAVAGPRSVRRTDRRGGRARPAASALRPSPAAQPGLL